MWSSMTARRHRSPGSPAGSPRSIADITPLSAFRSAGGQPCEASPSSAKACSAWLSARFRSLVTPTLLVDAVKPASQDPGFEHGYLEWANDFVLLPPAQLEQPDVGRRRAGLRGPHRIGDRRPRAFGRVT